MTPSSGNLALYIDRLIKALSMVDADEVERLKSQIASRMSGESGIFVIGNGGSAANAHHITGDYTKTFALKKQKLRIECLSDNNCYLTAASNDLDFSEIYEVLVGSRIRSKDLVIFLSGSGNSMNLVKAARAAEKNGVTVASITAYSGGAIKEISQIKVHAAIDDMEIAEDIQMIIMHHIKQSLCERLDESGLAAEQLVMAKYNKRICEGLVS